ncbi:hypothetical protein [Paenibacillus campi]|uniref:hypothetical protein n=1 Tax=Paenibacillus campi TaxID=3106031 RepID=UPI002AFE0298|nr:hypothetical protein [Paenibacillus sp. SGZ-1009]
MFKFFASKSFWITFIVFVLLYGLNVMVNDLPLGSVLQAFGSAIVLAAISAVVAGGIIYSIVHFTRNKNKYN